MNFPTFRAPQSNKRSSNLNLDQRVTIQTPRKAGDEAEDIAKELEVTKIQTEY